MKKILILSLLISCSQFFMSCENWFDVNPKSQVKNDILFENENGYKTALFDIYTTMATPALYGQELTMSLLTNRLKLAFISNTEKTFIISFSFKTFLSMYSFTCLSSPFLASIAAYIAD